jgi:hypothetical protein
MIRNRKNFGSLLLLLLSACSLSLWGQTTGISGRVTNESAVGIFNIRVSASSSDNVLYYAWTNSSGNYTISGLTAGNFKINFYNNFQNYVSEWYNDKDDIDSADLVAVTAGSTTANINAQLATGATISGRVTNSSSAGIQSIYVTVSDLDYDGCGYAYTDVNGNYTVLGLPAGGMKVCFQNNGQNYAGEWYNDKSSFATADQVTVTAGSTTANINAQLAAGGQISGRVTDTSAVGIQNILVDVSNLDQIELGFTHTDASGNYAVSGLPAGNFKVRFDSHGQNYYSEYYNDKGDFATADQVTVIAGNITANINAEMATGGQISGRVTNSAGIGIQNIYIIVNNFFTHSSDGYAYTDANGDYTAPALPAGYYQVFFSNNLQNYVSEWYNDKSNIDAADPVLVTIGNTTHDIDAQLQLASGILLISPNGGENWKSETSHNITWSSGGSIANVHIDYSADNGISWSPVAANTANDGIYSWTVPSITPSANCLVRVSDASFITINDISDSIFSISPAPAEIVSIPIMPQGANSGLKDTGYSFSSGGSASNLGHTLQYKFDWDDGTDSGWLAEGNISVSHSWAANDTYHVRAMARCATHTAIESLWSETLGIIISDSGSAGYYNSPASRLILPETSWAAASGGGDWVSELQLVDNSGGSTVQVYYNTGTNRRGPFTLWNNNSGAAGSSIKFSNIVQTIDGLDSGAFTYYGTNGGLEIITQDGSHLIQAAVRAYNGNFSRTFPALADVATNTAASGRSLLISNLSNDTAYRPSVVLFNPSADSVTAEVKIIGSNGSQVGSTINRTLAGYEQNTIVDEVRANTYSNADILVTVTGGSGRLIASGQSANNASNDPAAHVAVQTASGYANSPASRLILPETSWAPASGGGDWVSEVHVSDLSGGSVVTVYYNTGTSRRGPFTLWTNSGGANRSVTFGNILQTIDGLDAGPSTYNGTGGSLELLTQDGSHLIQAAVRTYNGNFSRTFPALQDREENTANSTRVLVIPNICNNSAYRPSVVLFNPSADNVTVEVKIIGGNGAQIGSTISRTLAGYEQNAIVNEVRADTYDNAKVLIQVTGGTGRVIASGQSANNASNDPAAHIAVQGQ